MAYNPDEEPTRQIRFRPEGAPNQQTNDPAGGPSPQRAEGNPANMPERYPGSASEEEPTLRQTFNPPETPPQQPTYPASAEGYSPMPPGSYLPQQQSGAAPIRQYPAAQGASPAQPGSHSQPSASYYPPPQQNYPPPGQGSYPPASPGAYQAEQPIYPNPRQGYPTEPYSAMPPSAPPRPATPTADQDSAASYSHYQYPSPAAAPPAQQARQYGYPPGAPGAGNAAAARSTSNARQFWRELTLLGQVSGVAGVLMVIFFFLPWLYTPNFSANLSGRTTIPTVTHSGWGTASGVQLFLNVPALNLFPHLWLVLLGALALIVLAVLLGRHRIQARTAALLISLISLGALLMEFFFLIQASSLGNAVRIGLSNATNQTLYGASWGFWLTVVATIAALGVGIYMLLEAYAPDKFRRPRAPGMPGGPSQYPTPTA